MNDEELNWLDDEELVSVIEKFEAILRNEANYFFDVEELEKLTDFYLEMNNTHKALKAIHFGLQQHPFSTELKIRHAQVLIAAHKPQQANEILSSIEAISQQNIDYYFTRASVYSQLRMPQKALDNLKRALELAEESEDREDIYISMAFEYENLSDFPKAAFYLQETLKENPQNETALYELVFCFEIAGNNEGCINYLTEFIDNNPYSYNAWFNLGLTYSHANQYEKALDAFDYALAIHEDFPSALYHKANVLIYTEKYEEAIATLKEMMRKEEPDAMCYYLIADCYENLGNYSKAIGYYQRALKIDPYMGDAYCGMAYCNACSDRLHAATHNIEKALEIDANNPDYLMLYADIQKRMGYVEEAIEAYEKTISLKPDFEQAYMELIILHTTIDEYDEALQLLSEAIHELPLSAPIHFKLAAVLLRCGYTEEAILAFEKAMQLKADGFNSFLIDCPEAIHVKEIQQIIDTYYSSDDL